jgi:hypothetical protein
MHVYAKANGQIDCVIPQVLDKFMSVDDAIRQAANNYAIRHNASSLGERAMIFPLKGA